MKYMTKTELIAAVAAELKDIPKSRVRDFLTAMIIVAGKSLRKDKTFVLPGVVKFKLVGVPPKAERKARNPATGKEMIVSAKPASKKLKAKFLKGIKVDVGIIPAPEKKDVAPKVKKTTKK
jgi:nucleoid DNA-binding protein